MLMAVYELYMLLNDIAKKTNHRASDSQDMYTRGQARALLKKHDHDKNNVLDEREFTALMEDIFLDVILVRAPEINGEDEQEKGSENFERSKSSPVESQSTAASSPVESESTAA